MRRRRRRTGENEKKTAVRQNRRERICRTEIGETAWREQRKQRQQGSSNLPVTANQIKCSAAAAADTDCPLVASSSFTQGSLPFSSRQQAAASKAQNQYWHCRPLLIINSADDAADDGALHITLLDTSPSSSPRGENIETLMPSKATN